MPDVALIRADAVQELANELQTSHAVIVNSPVVDFEGEKWYTGPIVISTVPKDFCQPTGIWFKIKTILKRTKMFFGGAGFH